MIIKDGVVMFFKSSFLLKMYTEIFPNKMKLCVCVLDGAEQVIHDTRLAMILVIVEAGRWTHGIHLLSYLLLFMSEYFF